MLSEHSRIRRPLFTMALTLLLAGVVALTGCGEAAPPLSAEVEGFRLIREADGTQFVTGTLHNPSERPLRAAQISVDLYDGNGEEGAAPTESMRLEVRDLEPGERKAFRQVVDTGLSLRGARVRNILLF
jgi:hypothetical protein